jgi:hypothetical protein
MALRENPKKAAGNETLKRSGLDSIDGTGGKVAFKLIVPHDS